MSGGKEGADNISGEIAGHDSADSAYFDAVVQRAMAVKESRNAAFRRKFDYWPSFYQNSLFAKEDVIEARQNLDFTGRLAFATECKRKGDEFFAKADYLEAINEYERALSMFTWIEPLSPNWRNEEIEDDKLKACSYTAESDDQRREINSLSVASYVNLAACYQKTKDWQNSFEACNYAITIDSKSGRAYFRRAQARILPATSGHIGDEELLALCDLKVAHELSPESQEITRAYVSLSLQVDEHRMKEKEMYQRAFRKNAEQGDKDKEKEKEKEKKVAKSVTSTNEHGHEQKGSDVVKPECSDSTPLDGVPASATDGSAGAAGAEGGVADKTAHTDAAATASAAAKKKPKDKEKEKKVKPKSDADVAGSGDKEGADKKPIVKPTTTAKSQEKNKLKSPEESMASARAAISTIEEAISRIKEVEARAEQLKKEGRHADALILTEKVKAAKAHIENLYEQQAKAEKIHQQWLEQQARAQGDGDVALTGEGDMRLRGNLFNINFMSPPPGVIADAKAHGLDLADRRACRIMHELQAEAIKSRDRAEKWAKAGKKGEDPESHDDFVARVIDKVYREESRELAAKLTDGLSRGILLEMLKARRRLPPVDLSKYTPSQYRLSTDARHLASVLIAGAGPGALSGLKDYEEVLGLRTAAANANAKDKGKKKTKGKHASDSNDGDGHGKTNGNGSGAAEGDGVIVSADGHVDAAVAGDDTGSSIVVADNTGGVDPAVMDLTDEQLDDMSKAELQRIILPFLGGDMFEIWRETDFKIEKDRVRRRKIKLGEKVDEEEDAEALTPEARKQREELDKMTAEERAEYEKVQREEEVYTMLQMKYGLDEDQIASDDKLKALKAQTNRSMFSTYALIIGVLGVLAFFLYRYMYSGGGASPTRSTVPLPIQKKAARSAAAQANAGAGPGAGASLSDLKAAAGAGAGAGVNEGL